MAEKENPPTYFYFNNPNHGGAADQMDFLVKIFSLGETIRLHTVKSGIVMVKISLISREDGNSYSFHFDGTEVIPKGRRPKVAKNRQITGHIHFESDKQSGWILAGWKYLNN